MKSAPFEYARPATIEEACAMLAADEGARIIAGGQTLVPMMAMRLARPTLLVDIARIPALSFIRAEDGVVVIGATTRQAAVERDALVRERVPLLAKALPLVGHAPTRTRGTLGGSLANADPSAEIALVAVALGSTLTWHDGKAAHDIAAADFFVGPMVTRLPEAACLISARFPVWPEPNIGVGFHEVSGRKSDFAFAAAAAQIAVDADGRCERVTIAIGGATSIPVRLDGVAQALLGTRPEDKIVREALRGAVETLDIIEDPYASVAYRKRAAAALAARAIADAYRTALSGGTHAR